MPKKASLLASQNAKQNLCLSSLRVQKGRSPIDRHESVGRTNEVHVDAIFCNIKEAKHEG